VPYFQWGTLRTLDEKKKYLYRLLQASSLHPAVCSAQCPFAIASMCSI
jgi:hypothetical protein